MPLLTAEAQKLSNDMLRQGVVENIITSDELFALLPFIPIDGKTYVYNRENNLGTAAFTDTDEVIAESSATFTKVSAFLKRLIGDTDVDEFLQNTHSDTTDQTSVQIATKAKVVGRLYADKLINGDETGFPKEFDGLIKLAPAGQTITVGVNGAPLTFDNLDELIDLVKIGGQRVFVMNSRTRRSFAALTRALGGTDPEHITMEGITGPVMSYRGVPILKNDFIPITQTQGTETAATTVFMIALDEDEGLTGLMSSNRMGIDVVDVGPVQNKDARRWRVRWYASLALHSELAMAAAVGINN